MSDRFYSDGGLSRMSKIQVSWYDTDKTILIQRFTRGWTLDDFYTTFPRSAALLQEPHGPLRAIFTDCTEDGMPPNNIMTGYKKAILHSYLPMVMVNPHTVSRLLFDSIRKAYKSQRAIYYVKSLGEAELVLRDHYIKREQRKRLEAS